MHGYITTIKNVSDKDVVDYYDSKEYVFPAGEEVTLPFIEASFFQGRHGRALSVISTERGDIRDEADYVLVRNVTDETLTAVYDGVDYVFAPQGSTKIPKELVAWMFDRDTLKGKLELVAEEAAVAAVEPVTAEASTELPAEKPKRASRSKKVTAEEAA